MGTTWSSVRRTGRKAGRWSSPSGAAQVVTGRTPSGLTVLSPSRYAAAKMAGTVERFARPGMQPSFAQEPKAISTFDFRRRRWASSSFSLLRMPPEKRQTSM